MALIVINPGHTGGYNQGICYGYYEGNTMLTLAIYLGNLLRVMGADVKFTRTTDTENPSVAQRGEMGANADLYFSLHSNAYDDPSVRGVDVFYSVQRPESEPLAARIGNAVAAVMGNQLRRVIAIPSTTNPSRDYYGELRAAVSVGARHALLVEHGFHTNMEDCELLSDDAVLRQIAAAEAVVIAQYFDLPISCLSNYIVQPQDSLYGIAQKFGVTWDSIALANSIAFPYIIMVGQRIIVPLPAGSVC